MRISVATRTTIAAGSESRLSSRTDSQWLAMTGYAASQGDYVLKCVGDLTMWFDDYHQWAFGCRYHRRGPVHGRCQPRGRA